MRGQCSILRALLPLLCATVLHSQFRGADAQPSDLCWDATPISGSGPFAFSLTESNTANGSQGVQCESNFVLDGFFCWQANTTGVAEFKACGPSGDSVLAVYSSCGYAACDQPAVTPLECDSDAESESCGFSTRVRLPVQSGNSYTIRVGTKDARGVSGRLSAAVFSKLIGDECSTANNAPLIDASLEPQVFLDFEKLTQSLGFFTPCADGKFYYDRWICFNLSNPTNFNLTYFFDTCSANASGDTVLALYDGCANCASWLANPSSTLQCSDDVERCGLGAQVRAIISPNTTNAVYTVRVGSYYSDLRGFSTGTLRVQKGYWRPPPPSNDMCRNARPLYGLGLVPFDTVGALPDSPLGCGENDVWYCYVAPFTGQIELEPCTQDSTGPQLETFINIIEGVDCNCDSLATLPASQHTCLNCSSYQFERVVDVVKDIRYLIHISSARIEDPAWGEFRIIEHIDNFDRFYARRITLGGEISGQFRFNNLGLDDTVDLCSNRACSQSCDSLYPSNEFGNSVWYIFTPNIAGIYTIDTCNSPDDTALGAYLEYRETEQCLPQITYNDDTASCLTSAGTLAKQSRINVRAQANQTLYIRVGTGPNSTSYRGAGVPGSVFDIAAVSGYLTVTLAARTTSGDQCARAASEILGPDFTSRTFDCAGCNFGNVGPVFGTAGTGYASVSSICGAAIHAGHGGQLVTLYPADAMPVLYGSTQNGIVSEWSNDNMPAFFFNASARNFPRSNCRVEREVSASPVTSDINTNIAESSVSFDGVSTGWTLRSFSIFVDISPRYDTHAAPMIEIQNPITNDWRVLSFEAANFNTDVFTSSVFARFSQNARGYADTKTITFPSFPFFLPVDNFMLLPDAPTNGTWTLRVSRPSSGDLKETTIRRFGVEITTCSDFCGDFLCGPAENFTSCPQDCRATELPFMNFAGDGACRQTPGGLLCWGGNFHGQLLQGDRDSGLDLGTLIPVATSGYDFQMPMLAGGNGLYARIAQSSCCGEQTRRVQVWGNLRALGFAENFGDDPDEAGSSFQTISFAEASGGNALRGCFETCPPREAYLPVQLDIKDSHLCIVSLDGFLRCVGSNSDGQIGAGRVGGDQAVNTAPVILRNVRQVATGYRHTCALMVDGAVRCWGNSVGSGNAADAARPAAPLDLGEPATQVAASDGISCVVLESGCLKCFGLNTGGRLGQGIADSARVIRGADLSVLPCVNLLGAGQPKMSENTSVYLERRSAVKVVCGRAHVCVLLDNLQVVCFGDNSFAQLGAGTPIPHIGLGPSDMGQNLSAVNVGANSVVLEIAAGDVHTCVTVRTTIRTNQNQQTQLKCWGSTEDGRLGVVTPATSVGSDANQMGNFLLPVTSNPTQVLSFDISHGHACAVFSGDNLMKCWGANDRGQCGTSTTHGASPFSMGPYLLPVAHGVAPNASWILEEVATGGAFSCGLFRRNGQVLASIKCWGDNTGGALLHNTTIDTVGLDPNDMGDALVFSLKELPIAQLCAGQTFACVRYADNSSSSRFKVGCWGVGKFGELGSNSVLPIGRQPGDQPLQLTFGGRSVSDLACGAYHACVVLEDYTVRCWGNAGDGRLGYGADQPWFGYPDPATAEPGDLEHIGDDVGDISVNDLPPVALGPRGSVYGAVDVECGGAHTCVILRKNSGTPFDTIKTLCWGSNSHGQLGLNKASESIFGKMLDDERFVNPAAGSILLYDSIRAMTLGDRHTCIITTPQQQLKCWGSNEFGQLGLSADAVLRVGLPTDSAKRHFNLDPAPSSVRVPGDQVLTAAAGGNSTCALLLSGRLVCFGQNDNGQLGQGNRIDTHFVRRQNVVPLETCINGTGITGSTYACEACSPGYVKSDSPFENTCVPCDAGSYAPDSGLIACIQCPPGSFADSAGSATCAKCAAGTASNVSGAIACSPCTPGFAALVEGLTECSACPIGTRAEIPGSLVCSPCNQFSFAARSASASCVPCPDRASSLSRKGAECRCIEGLYLTANNTCDECPSGGICLDGILIGTEAGYWQSDTNFDAVYVCPSATACLDSAKSPAQKCRDGHIGPVCAQCNTSFYMQPTLLCDKCPDASANIAWMVVAGVAALFVVAILVWRFSVEIQTAVANASSAEDDNRGRNADDEGGAGDKSSSSGGGGGGMNWRALVDVPKLRVLIGFLQVFSSLEKTFNVPWPGAFIDFVASLSFINLDFIDFTGITCLAGSETGSFYIGFLFMIFMPPTLIALLAMILFSIYGVFKLRYKFLPVGIPFNALIHYSFMLMFLVYPGVSHKVLAILKCQTIDGIQYLEADYTIVCWEGAHIGYTTIGIIAIICYPVAVPLITAFILYRYKRVIRHDMVVREVERRREERTNRRARQHSARRKFRSTYFRHVSQESYKGRRKPHPSALTINEHDFYILMEHLKAENTSFAAVVSYTIQEQARNGTDDELAERHRAGTVSFKSLKLSEVEHWWLSPDADPFRSNKNQLYQLSDNIQLRFYVNHAYAIMSESKIARPWGAEAVEFIDPKKVCSRTSRELVQHRFGSLYNDYVARAFWYEIWDMTRKMLLVGALIFVPRGTTLQIGMGLLVSVFALVLHTIINPYVDKATDRFQFMALSVLSLTLFAGVLLKASANDKTGNQLQTDYLGAFLVIINGLVLLFALMLFAMKFWELGRQIQDFRKEVHESKKKTKRGEADDAAVDPADMYSAARLLERGRARVTHLGEFEMIDMGKQGSDDFDHPTDSESYGGAVFGWGARSDESGANSDSDLSVVSEADSSSCDDTVSSSSDAVISLVASSSYHSTDSDSSR